MKHLLRSRNFYIIFLIDAILVVVSLFLSYSIRFEFQIPDNYLNTFFQTLPIVLFIKVSLFFFFRMYQGMWRYTSLVDLLNVIKATTTSSGLIILAILLVYRFEGYPRSVFMIDWGLTLIFVGGVRIGVRLYFSQNLRGEILPTFSQFRYPGKKLMIIGAGDAGEKMLREILENPTLKIQPVGFLDDDQRKQGKTIHGVKVLGVIQEIGSFLERFDEILIALPSASANQMRAIVEACNHTNKPFRTVPAIAELIDGQVSVKTIRKVSVQDLLGREEVTLNKENISKCLQHKRVLVTGAGGSIGSELVRQISKFYPESIAFFEMSEFNLFRIDMECQQRFPYIKRVMSLGDIRSQGDVKKIFQEFRPQVVFHTAAYKHVPIQELHPWEAVLNNVLGTQNIVKIAREHGVERFVLVSTDKAVRPANVMGATKRVAEKIVGGANGDGESRFMVVRFGNVIGSSGSVIPTFQEQIERGGPVTVTHPEVTRYFMSIPEAAQLTLEAGAMGVGGETFILNMGKPVKIADMARDLIRLHGYEPDRDIAIQYTGLRPGEKLYEELITEGEGIVATTHEKIMVLRGHHDHLEMLPAQIAALLEIASTYDSTGIKQKLHDIVPEYTPELLASDFKTIRGVS
jgi:FlaA1/EpsC-like NDP-sugar epimerase